MLILIGIPFSFHVNVSSNFKAMMTCYNAESL